ncbi:BLUF domain-containing protein [Nioella nitratireducens]|uniref:BLUF domain-containing protein n=1 Tax=Nioella nitratireducens TaxID=1287720 RepID=UPI001314BACB|nr:BLUF domain-containing protein [Nioella nitratireducens]
MSKLIGVAYCSKATQFSFREVDEILKVSRTNNARDGLTGALIYDNATFLQWLEGGESEIRQVFGRISRDERHSEIKLLSVRSLEGRWFPDWSMTAAVTEGQTLRGLKLVPHISLSGFDPYGWSEEDVATFMTSLSDYLTRRPAPKSERLPEQVAPRKLSHDPMVCLDRHLRRGV